MRTQIISKSIDKIRVMSGIADVYPWHLVLLICPHNIRAKENHRSLFLDVRTHLQSSFLQRLDYSVTHEDLIEASRLLGDGLDGDMHLRGDIGQASQGGEGRKCLGSGAGDA